MLIAHLGSLGPSGISLRIPWEGRHLEVVNLADNGREDLATDLVAIVYNFSARLYGQLRAKRKTEALIKELTEWT